VLHLQSDMTLLHGRDMGDVDNPGLGMIEISIENGELGSSYGLQTLQCDSSEDGVHEKAMK
jgi:hypothetical protein